MYYNWWTNRHHDVTIIDEDEIWLADVYDVIIDSWCMPAFIRNKIFKIFNKILMESIQTFRNELQVITDTINIHKLLTLCLWSTYQFIKTCNCFILFIIHDMRLLDIKHIEHACSGWIWFSSGTGGGGTLETMDECYFLYAANLPF